MIQLLLVSEKHEQHSLFHKQKMLIKKKSTTSEAQTLKRKTLCSSSIDLISIAENTHKNVISMEAVWENKPL